MDPSLPLAMFLSGAAAHLSSAGLPGKQQRLHRSLRHGWNLRSGPGAHVMAVGRPNDGGAVDLGGMALAR